jgi:hypothetical protein
LRLRDRPLGPFLAFLQPPSPSPLSRETSPAKHPKPRRGGGAGGGGTSTRDSSPSPPHQSSSTTTRTPTRPATELTVIHQTTPTRPPTSHNLRSGGPPLGRVEPDPSGPVFPSAVSTLGRCACSPVGESHLPPPVVLGPSPRRPSESSADALDRPLRKRRRCGLARTAPLGRRRSVSRQLRPQGPGICDGDMAEMSLISPRARSHLSCPGYPAL